MVALAMGPTSTCRVVHRMRLESVQTGALASRGELASHHLILEAAVHQGQLSGLLSTSHHMHCTAAMVLWALDATSVSWFCHTLHNS